jgi:hypothetical protein
LRNKGKIIFIVVLTFLILAIVPPIITYQSAATTPTRLVVNNNINQHFTMVGMKVVNVGLGWDSMFNCPAWMVNITGHVTRGDGTGFDLDAWFYVNAYLGTLGQVVDNV